METAEVENLRAQINGTPNPTPASPEVAQTQAQAAATPAPATVIPIAEAGAQASSAATPTPTPEVAAAFNELEYLKSTYGVESKDALTARLARIQELEAQVATPKEYVFTDENAKRIAHAINTGDFKTVKEFADAQVMLTGVEALPTEQQLKLFIKMQNPLFDQELIDYTFNKKYSFNAEDFDDPMEQRMQRMTIEQNKQNDLASAQALFNDRRAKVQLPEIKTAATPDEAYEQWKQVQAANAQAVAQSVAGYAKLTPKDVAHTFKFNDEALKLNIDVAYEPDPASFEAVRTILSDDAKFLQDYSKPDGSLAYEKLAKDMQAGRNIDKIVSAAITQAVSATQRWFLANQKNIETGAIKIMDTTEPSEIDRTRAAIFGK